VHRTLSPAMIITLPLVIAMSARHSFKPPSGIKNEAFCEGDHA
jgi:hypothetical protein